jgi:hypothetical protein
MRLMRRPHVADKCATLLHELLQSAHCGLDDDEYSELQQFLMQNPEAGELVPGSGGVRKARWSRPGMESEAGFESSTSYGTSRASSGC